jgi:hypothetical protein
VLVPALIFLAGLSIGVLASARWLPDLAPGQVGGLAFFVVCGLIGAAAGLLGVHIYSIVQELDSRSLLGGRLSQGVLLAAELRSLIFEVGSLVGFASIVYLLAPPPEIDGAPEAEAAN